MKSNENNWRDLILKLREIAKEKNMTQQDLADVTGFKQQYISRMFVLQNSPSIENAMKIASALGVSIVIKKT